jgi:deoxycytidine triphosphate deaminase
MLNSRQILDQKIITGPIDDDMVAQVGVDLRVIEIKSIYGGGVVPQQGKTKLAHKEPVKRNGGREVGLENAVWLLQPGAYDVTFEQGCDIPADKVMLLRQRSSLLRNGSILHSSVFDPGFSTKNVGTVLIVISPIVIEFKARIAQAYIHECTEVASEDLYDGQFQGDKQRDQSKNVKDAK